MIAPIMRGEEVSFSLATYKCIIKDCPLPTEIEAKITNFCTFKRMRKSHGEYPLMRFTRLFLGTIWAHKGSYRINRTTCLEMSGQTLNRMPQLKYKKLLADAGLISGGWERTIIRHKGAALYKMTPDTLEVFQSHYQEAIQPARA